MKEWKFTESNSEAIDSLQEVLGVNSVFCTLLTQRGIYDYDASKAFFRPELDDLHDPFLMKDMQTAVERLDRAVANDERILIYGDYDVDGTTSVSLMYKFLVRFHYKLDYYIPDRFTEGYGLSKEGIAYASRQGYSLIICLDCGTRDLEAVEEACAAGIDIIIGDHHLPGETLPNAVALLNPKQEGCNYPFKELSACGVAFKLAQAYTQYKSWSTEPLYKLLDLVAVSIACDYVEMRGENRVLTFYGLKQFNTKPSTGFAVLKNRLERPPMYTIQDIVFSIGPVINAAGRMGHAKSAVRLLLSVDKYSANIAVKVLMELNKQRKKKEHIMLEEAVGIVQSGGIDVKHSIVVNHEYWHKGVVGIIASRMVERYNRPAVVLAPSGDKWSGSVRSAQQVNLITALDDCADLLETHGGHAFAAGVTLKSDQIAVFRNRF